MSIKSFALSSHCHEQNIFRAKEMLFRNENLFSEKLRISYLGWIEKLVFNQIPKKINFWKKTFFFKESFAVDFFPIQTMGGQTFLLPKKAKKNRFRKKIKFQKYLEFNFPQNLNLIFAENCLRNLEKLNLEIWF